MSKHCLCLTCKATQNGKTQTNKREDRKATRVSQLSLMIYSQLKTAENSKIWEPRDRQANTEHYVDAGASSRVSCCWVLKSMPLLQRRSMQHARLCSSQPCRANDHNIAQLTCIKIWQKGVHDQTLDIRYCTKALERCLGGVLVLI